MNDKPRVQRALLRRALRKQMKHEDQATVQMLQLALDDEAMFETTYESSMSQAQKFCQSTGSFSISISRNGQPEADNLLKLLQWFITNGPQLIEIIQQIIGLFGSISVATQLCEDETMFVE